MPNFDSNDPGGFGWSLGTAGVVKFVYRGHEFYSGVQALLVPIFTEALNRICAQAGFKLHSGSGVDDGMWGYEDRKIAGGDTWSFHAYGNAIDVNAPWNPYGSSTPPGSPFRMPMNTSHLVEPLGLVWGGGSRFGTLRDWMHLENHNTPAEAQAYSSRPAPPPRPAPDSVPFPLPAGYYYGPYSGPTESISGQASTDGPYRPGLVLAQQHLGVPADGFYGPVTAASVRRMQAELHLAVDGLIGPLTWRALVTRPLF